jgi:hypothetical protein
LSYDLQSHPIPALHLNQDDIRRFRLDFLKNLVGIPGVPKDSELAGAIQPIGKRRSYRIVLIDNI